MLNEKTLTAMFLKQRVMNLESAVLELMNRVSKIEEYLRRKEIE